jgi:REP element-mobilizing transposase RayT
MSRLRRIERVGRYFFVTTNLIRGTPPLSPTERSLCLDHLDRSRAKLGFSLFAYVAMPDHVHLLLSTFQSELATIMRTWKGQSAFAISRLRGIRGAIWQPRYFDFILRRAGDFAKEFKYVHDNPVDAGLAGQPEEWPWSSAAFYFNKTQTHIRPDLFEMPVDANQPLWPVPGR